MVNTNASRQAAYRALAAERQAAREQMFRDLYAVFVAHAADIAPILSQAELELMQRVEGELHG